MMLIQHPPAVYFYMKFNLVYGTSKSSHVLSFYIGCRELYYRSYRAESKLEILVGAQEK